MFLDRFFGHSLCLLFGSLTTVLAVPQGGCRNAASRRRHIAKGSGVSVTELNTLLNRFGQMQQMMRKMGKMQKMMARMGGLPGMGR